MKRYPEKKGETFLSAPQLASIGAALAELEANGASHSAIAIICLLALTGARKSEIASLKWSEVDFDRSHLRLGDSKTGAKVIPIGAPAIEVLAGLARVGGSGFVFPAASGPGHFRVRTRSGVSCEILPGFPI